MGKVGSRFVMTAHEAAVSEVAKALNQSHEKWYEAEAAVNAKGETMPGIRTWVIAHIAVHAITSSPEVWAALLVAHGAAATGAILDSLEGEADA